MEKSKLITILSTFSSGEWRSFNDYVRSPYFNKHSDALRLFVYLKKLAPDHLHGEAISRRQAFQQVFPGQPYDERSFNHLMSKLLKLAEQFLGWRRLENTGVIFQTHLLEELADRKLEKSFEHHYRKATRQLEARPERDDRYHFQKYLLADLALRRIWSQHIRTHDPNLQEAADHLQYFFLARQLRYWCAMLNRQRLFAVDYEQEMAPEILQYLNRKKEDPPPAVAVYQKAFLLLQKPEVNTFFAEFRQNLPTMTHFFSPLEGRELYYLAINFCTHKIRLGERDYAEVLLDLYREGLQNEILLEEGALSPWSYKNMIKLGLNLQKFDWVEYIVKTYTDKLDEAAKEDAFHFNLADLYYHRGDYEQALDHLNRVEFSDIHYNLGAKAMLLRIYHEKGETEAFLSLSAAFGIFLRRNQFIAKNIKASYANFTRLLTQIHKYGDQKKERLRKQVLETKALYGRSWLLKQLE